MPKGVTRSESEPHDRLTRLCEAMLAALKAHPEHKPDDKVIIRIDNDKDKRGGMVTGGYEDDGEALATMVSHVEAFARSLGFDLRYVPVEPNEG